MERSDVLDGDESIWIDLVNALPYGSDLAAFHAAIQNRNRSVFSPPGNLRHGVSSFANCLRDRAPPSGADDADVAEANGQTFLDHHADNIACGKSAGVSNEVEEIIQVAEHAGDGDNPQCGLEESEDPGERFAPPDNKKDPHCIQRHIRYTQEEYYQWHESRVDCKDVEHRFYSFVALLFRARKRW